MKIVISDYPSAMEQDYALTIQAIKNILPEAEIVIHPFSNNDKLYEVIENAEGIITAYLAVNDELLEHAKKLKAISVSAVGYENVDLIAAKKYQIGICHIAEYCTQEVAEHTLALILALTKNLKFYTKRIEKEFEWKYHSIPGGNTLSNQKLAIFGFGRIGKRVAKLADAFGMEIMAVDPYASKEETNKLGIQLTTAEEAFKEADIISNHMNLTKDNYHFFNHMVFEKMKKSPLFINVGRGACVDEAALTWALDTGLIRGAGLDVLGEEEPSLAGNPLLGRDNVIITPHSAFYSMQSLEKLQRISGINLACYLSGKKDKINKLICG